MTLNFENGSEIIMNRTESISEIRIENKKNLSVITNQITQAHVDDRKTKESKLNSSVNNKSECSAQDIFQTLTKNVLKKMIDRLWINYYTQLEKENRRSN